MKPVDEPVWQGDYRSTFQHCGARKWRQLCLDEAVVRNAGHPASLTGQIYECAVSAVRPLVEKATKWRDDRYARSLLSIGEKKPQPPPASQSANFSAHKVSANS